MSRHGQSRTRDIVSFIFGFFLALDLAVMAVLLVVRVGVFAEQSFLGLFDDEYYGYVLKYATDKATYYTYPTGIVPSVVEGVFTEDDVQRDVNNSVLAAFRGTDYVADLSDAEERLTNNVTSFFEEGGAVTSGEREEIISSYVGEIMDIYLKAIRVPGLDAIAQVRNTYLDYATVGLIVCVALAVVLVVTLRRLHHFAHRSMRYMAYATGGAALMCLVAPSALYLSGAYRGLKLKPQHFYHFGVSATARVLQLTILSGIAFLIVTVVLVAVVARKRSNLVKRSSGRHHSS